jgi:hypothetical protein
MRMHFYKDIQISWFSDDTVEGVEKRENFLGACPAFSSK